MADGHPIYLPWPMVMDIADSLDANGYTQLAREARQKVWDEAERRFQAEAAASSPKEATDG